MGCRSTNVLTGEVTEWREGAVVALVAGVIGTGITLRLMRGTWREESGARPPWRETLAGLRRSVLAFSTEQPGRLIQVFLLDLTFHALAVFEIFLTLRWLLGDRSPTLAQAIVFDDARNTALRIRAAGDGVHIVTNQL